MEAKNNILFVKVSCFKDYSTPDNPKTVTLSNWLKSDKYKGEVEKIIGTQDKTIRNALKSKLPAITPSGVFSQRGEQYLIKHSSFIQFDIDRQDNPNIDIHRLKVDIMKLQCIAYCGLSVSGLGLWGLIRISHPEKHKEQFFAISQVFKSLGINIDQSCKDVSRLRGYSYDPEGQFNYNAIPFVHTSQPQRKKQITVANQKDNYHKVQHCIDQLNGTDITQGYQNWFSLGCSLASEFGESGRNFFHEISRYHSEYDPHQTDRQYDHCINNHYGYSIGTFFEICKQHNILFIGEKIDKSKDSDIFCKMAKKNPSLLSLRDKFDLISGNDNKELICN